MKKVLNSLINGPVKTAPFMVEFCKTASNLYRLGWDERNGGNMSMILNPEEVEKYLDIDDCIREIEMSFAAPELAKKILLVTGTGKYFKNVEEDPERNLGIIRISEDGKTAKLLWGWSDGGRFTSELPAHLMSHAARLKQDPEHRVVIHTHPTHSIAMSFVHPATDKDFSHTLWQMMPECLVVFPDGVGVLPFMVCGTNEIGEATAKKMEEFRVVVWSQHGVYGVGKDLDETFGLIETVEKAAQIYLLINDRKWLQTITDNDLRDLAKAFNLTYREDFLGK